MCNTTHMSKLSPKQKANIERFKQNGSKVPSRQRQEIIKPKGSWWTEPDFEAAKVREAGRLRHNTQGITAGDNF